jgi:hypothetical protein
MMTIERRLTELERARLAYVGPMLLLVDDEPTAEQLLVMKEDARIGRPVVRVNSLDVNL